MSLVPDSIASFAPTAAAAQKMREALAMLDELGAGVAACLLQQAIDVIDAL
jgi:hypothetical protein